MRRPSAGASTRRRGAARRCFARHSGWSKKPGWWKKPARTGRSAGPSRRAAASRRRRRSRTITSRSPSRSCRTCRKSPAASARSRGGKRRLSARRARPRGTSACRRPRERQPPRRPGDGHVRPRARRGSRGGGAADTRPDRPCPGAARRGDVRQLRALREPDRRGPAPRATVGHALHRRPAARRPGIGPHVSEPSLRPQPDGDGRRPPDIRVGSSTNARAPVSLVERRLGAGCWQWAGLAAVSVAAVAGDQLTKQVVRSHLRIDESASVIGPLSIHRVQNSGIAFGLFSSATALVTVLTAIAVGWMLVFFARSGARHPVLPAALGLLIGGSVSNLVDRVRLGHVTDFIDFGWWPAFNLADSFIVIGVAILLAALLGADRRPKDVRRPLDVAAR